jgi:prolycopene isomerase
MLEKYDVVIIGGGIGSITTATYLTKRLRNVAVFEEDSSHKISNYTKRFRDKERHQFEFKYFHQDLGGVHPGDLFYEYLKRCGIENAFNYIDNEQTTIVTPDRRIIKRPNNIDGFKVYLVRHYPKQRDAIYRLFDDIMRHYKDFKQQKVARLKNKEFTVSSLLIEWGDLNLYTLLQRYFTSANIMNEFLLMHNSAGLELEEVNAYYYFIKWFDVFIDGAHFILNSYDDIISELSKEISKSRQKIFTDRKIEKVLVKDNKILKVFDTNGKEIRAKHYVINMRIDDFAERYLSNSEQVRNDFLELYPSIEKRRYINRVYLGFSKPTSYFGMNRKQYIFSHIEEDEMRFISMTNYKQIDPKCCTGDRSAVLIEYIDNGEGKQKQLDKVVKQFFKYYPMAKEFLVLKRIDDKIPYFGGVAKKSFWYGKSLNDLFLIDDYSTLNPFENSYFVGYWSKPESGITGIIQTGVEYGDLIDEDIYHGDGEDYFITHSELMNLLSNQFIPGSLGKTEKNIQFFIGKDTFFIRTKGKHQRLYKGTSDIFDISIVATNECLYNLSVGNTTLEEAIKNGTLEFVGDKEFLEEVFEAFDMGIASNKPERYKYIPGKWGIKIMLAQFSVILLSNLLSNYHLYIYLAPLTLLAFGGLVYYKYRTTKHISVFEYVVMSLYFILSILSIFITSINEHKDSTYTLIFFTVYFLFTWLINIPLAFEYVRHDYRTDFTRTKLFLKMTGGLTFIWGTTFFAILIAELLILQSYAALFYYLVPLALYLSFYYPSKYIQGYYD